MIRSPSDIPAEIADLSTDVINNPVRFPPAISILKCFSITINRHLLLVGNTNKRRGKNYYCYFKNDAYSIM